MKQAERYLAIDSAKKQRREARQSTATDREQESYSATEKVKSYTANAARDTIYYAAYRQENAFHHETDYAEAPSHKAPTPQERMRREAVKEYRQAKAEQSKNAFHRETDYTTAPAPRAEKPQKQMLQSFLEGESETAPLLQAGEAPAVSPIKNEAESVKPRIRPKKREIRESVKSPITVTGQRQTALPRNTSSIKTAKKQLISKR